METVSKSLQSNRMGTLPEGKLLWSMGVPLSLSMLIQALYNIVDSIFVSYLGEKALTAVSLAYPMNMLMIAFAVGTGVGVNSLISRRLGARLHSEADRAATQGMLVMLVTAGLFVLFGLFGVKPFIHAYTDDPELAQMGITYLSICCTFCVGVFMQIFCERVMQSQGKNFDAMLMQLIGAVFNIVFDPILIFGLFGFPKLGIAGAAIATVGGQIFSMLFSLVLVFSKRSEVRVRLRGFAVDFQIIRDIYAVGLPSVVMQAIGTVMNLAMNALLIGLTATAVAVFGVYFKVQSVALMPLLGVTNAAMSIMAYNYGARNRARLMRTWKLTIRAGVIMMLLCTAVFELFPQEILRLFNASDEMLRIGTAAIRIIALCLPIAAFNISSSVLFQAVGNGLYSMWMSLIRQLFVLVPVAWALAAFTGDAAAVWWSCPIAEGVALIVCVILLTRTFNSRIAQLDLPPASETAL